MDTKQVPIPVPAAPEPSPAAASVAPLPGSGPFAGTEYHFTTSVPAGETATVRAGSGQTLLTYRSFAGIVGTIAALVSWLVGVAGLAAAGFLWRDAPLWAIAALVLTAVFAIFIAMLAPRVHVTLYDAGNPALTITQRAQFPGSAFVVTTPNGAHLAEIRKSALSRLGRHRWKILHEGRFIGEAHETSFPGALRRKFIGKFSRRFETDVVVAFGGLEAGRIRRRPDAAGRVDVLEVLSDALDRRVLVAIAVLVLGREP